MKRNAFFLLLTTLFLIFPQMQFAQENLAALKMVNPPIKEAEQTADYELPYPGLLPDSPLYPLKMLRDRLVGLLVSDPLKKAELSLLSADKRLNAAFYLFNSAKLNEKKRNLVISTISKAENYFEEAISKTSEAKKQGADTADLLRRLSQSAKKHLAIVKNLEKQSPPLKEKFMKIEERIIGFEKRVELLRSK